MRSKVFDIPAAEEGDVRVRRVFLWFPKTLKCSPQTLQRRWLEFATLREECVGVVKSHPMYGPEQIHPLWAAVDWVDEEKDIP